MSSECAVAAPAAASGDGISSRASPASAGKGASAQSAGAEVSDIIAYLCFRFDRNDPAAPNLDGWETLKLDDAAEMHEIVWEDKRRRIRRREAGKVSDGGSSDEDHAQAAGSGH